MRWFFPSFSGDFRLVADGTKTSLVMLEPTPAELQALGRAGYLLAQKKWVDDEVLWDPAGGKEQVVGINSPINKVAPIFAKELKPGKATLTAVKFHDGRVESISGDDLDPAALEKPAEAAVTVKRPTPSCPECQVEPIPPAREVIEAFLTDAERSQWEQEHRIVVYGGRTGHRYLLSHRNSPTAAFLGKICCDLDDAMVLKFHDILVPPEEEVLAAKLILEHREDWLRNEATVFGIYLPGFAGNPNHEDFSRPLPSFFKNPFGGIMDGVETAKMYANVGIFEQCYNMGKAL